MAKSNRTDTDPRHQYNKNFEDLSISLLNAQKTVAKFEIKGKKKNQNSLNRSYEQYTNNFNRQIKNQTHHQNKLFAD